MKIQAKNLGHLIVETERQLDKLFASGNISKSKIKELLENVGELKSNLRFTHVKAHMKTKIILTQMQVKHYNKLRGYSNAGNEQNMHSHHSHNT